MAAVDVGADDVGKGIDRVIEHDHLAAALPLTCAWLPVPRCAPDRVEVISAVEQG